MKLDYIYHSGFAIEADGITVIIDYYKDLSRFFSSYVSWAMYRLASSRVMLRTFFLLPL